jgi:hypothetical protein
MEEISHDKDTNLYEQFLSKEMTSCHQRSAWNEYRSVYNELYHLHPQDMCMPNGREADVDREISFRGNPLQKIDTPRCVNSNAEYIKFYQCNTGDTKKNTFISTSTPTPSIDSIFLFDENTSAKLRSK